MSRPHWDECWLDPRHHYCAVAEIQRLQAERDRLRQELGNIANAQPVTQGDNWLGEFRDWAQSRARLALEGLR